MIIVKFSGGLGNQMLQYASYVALQERYPGVKVLADARQFKYVGIHNGLELERLFPIRLAVEGGVDPGTVSGLRMQFQRVVHKMMVAMRKAGFNRFRYLKDNNVFNPELFHLDPAKNYYLEGYWGNQKYFENAMGSVRDHFTFKIPLDAENNDIALNIIRQNSVSIHVRRGDYVAEGSAYVDLTTTGYYPDAFNYVTGRVSDPVLYLFSNDIPWCRTNLTWVKKYEHHFVEGNNGADSYKDMQLMALCKHNIIANSSFSWWGAWLNNHPDKIVVCPATYVYDAVKNTRIIEEFYPPGWVIM